MVMRCDCGARFDRDNVEGMRRHARKHREQEIRQAIWPIPWLLLGVLVYWLLK